jgi:beta-galactosidase
VKVLVRAIAVAALLTGAIAGGVWLGRWRASSLDAPADGVGQSPAMPEDVLEIHPSAAAPLFFFACGMSPSNEAVIADEMRLAAAAGIHQFLISVPLQWGSNAGEPDLCAIATALEADPDARLFVHVDLNPPREWLDAHPDSAIPGKDGRQPFAHPASAQWLSSAQDAVRQLIHAVSSSQYRERVKGFYLSGLQNGAWILPRVGGDLPANTSGFCAWLRRRYETDEALRLAWDDEEATIDGAEVPETLDNADQHRVFFDVPKMQRHVDFLEYLSDSVADAIIAFTEVVKNTATETAVYVPYGQLLETDVSAVGQLRLGRLLRSRVDGFATPISYSDRGLGGTGGFMGPVDSARCHGKLWILLDDTRTGVTCDSSTGAVQYMEGLRTEDIYNVQRRNFAAALTHGLGLCWMDPRGEGWLHDPKTWQLFGAMRSAYERVLTDRPSGDTLFAEPTLLVVVDERSPLYQSCGAELNRRVLSQVREAVLRASVPTRFCLLSDVLENKAPRASVYLFANVFHLTEEERQQLHGLLEAELAAAIWMYAPGYIAEQGDVGNISATTGIETAVFDEPAESGSVCELSGRYVSGGEMFGDPLLWDPLFYIAADDTNVIAKYAQSEKPSVALEFFESGWASIYVAEPALPPGLLRELLFILNEHLYLPDAPQRAFDTAYFGNGVLAIHAKAGGQRVLDLGERYSAQDVLDSEVGWPLRQFITFSLKPGETRILELTAAEDEASGVRSRRPSDQLDSEQVGG